MSGAYRAIPRLRTLNAHFAAPGPRNIIASKPRGRGIAARRAMATSSDIPKTMKAVQIEEHGGVEVLKYRTDMPVPTPKEDEILVKNSICGVNFIDTYHRTGLYKVTLPRTLGTEAAGVAVTTSAANPYIKAGQRCVVFTGGTYAEYTAVAASKVAAVPDHISLETACTVFVQGLTCLMLIEESYAVQKGDWILVPAAAGGTGGLLCQMLRARGAHIIATASTEAKRQRALNSGADVAVPYEDTLDTVNKYTDGKGVAAVLDGVGQSTFDTSLQAVARKGTVVSFGNASGAVEPFRISRLSEKNAKVTRPVLMNSVTTVEEMHTNANKVWELVGKEDGKGGPGRLKVEVHEVYPLSDAKRAHTDIEARKTTGKLLLDPSK